MVLDLVSSDSSLWLMEIRRFAYRVAAAGHVP
jgi:hypothetical protein